MSRALRFSAILALGLASAIVVRAGEKPDVTEVAATPLNQTQRAALPALARISFAQAMQTALTALPGAIIKAELEVEDGRLMYAFEIVVPNKQIKEVEIDARDGRVLDISND